MALERVYTPCMFACRPYALDLALYCHHVTYIDTSTERFVDVSYHDYCVTEYALVFAPRILRES